MKPFFSCVCVTYGRVAHLQRSLACFLAQKYDGKIQMVILNTFPDQELTGDFPNVKIVNLKTRPKTLGEARNIAIENADGTHIIVWDDDDLFGVQHADNFARGLTPENHWAFLDRQFFCERFEVKKIVGGQMPCFAFSKEAWKAAGGYTNLTVGEDRHFIGKLTASFNGTTVPLKNEEISFFYGWDNNSFHVSGMGVDRPGLMPSHKRIEDDLRRRVKNGMEKTGVIEIKPEIVDMSKMASDFLARSHSNSNPKSVCIVMLGRYGDIINCLPICKHIAEQYAKPHLMVSREFASVLDGASYVIPEVVDIPYDRIGAGVELAKSKFSIVLRGQIWGTGHLQDKLTDSYNRESFRELGFLNRFDDRDFELHFDQRSPEREQKLVDKLKTDKPMLLVKVTCGMSSPFPAGPAVLDVIRQTFGEKFNVVDLSVVQCERIYDLLGLMDSALGLVTIDTSIVHLAAAANVPTILIANPMPWAGTMPRCNCVARLTYNDNAGVICEVVSTKLIQQTTDPEAFPLSRKPISNPPKCLLYHAVERHPDQDMANINRKREAQKTWDSLYEDGGVVPCHYRHYDRTALDIGDRRALPYLKDVLKYAMDQAGDDDIIMWTNDDNSLHPQLSEVLHFCVSAYGAVCAQRVEFRRAPVGGSPEEWVRIGERHMGRDLFAFKKSWLVEHWVEMPDFILGACIWDLALACIVRLDNGIITTRRNIESHIFPAEIPLGYVGHIKHQNEWSKPKNLKSAAELHNKRLFRDWSTKNLPELRFTESLDI